MIYTNNHTKVEDVKIAYIGGGSRGWARGIMSDLAMEGSFCGTVYLYDIDFDAAKCNAQIGNMYAEKEETLSKWKYKAVPTLKEALIDADFVIISILPGTFDEMESDVHTPEKYGIYQSVGDTSGPGGIVRALRTLPMFKVIAEGVRDYCPNAWVINYTNPMTMCVSALYKYFPKIKAFGCCHEVFSTQKLIANAYKEKLGDNDLVIPREDIKVDVVGINHFTWLTSASYYGIDLWDTYAEFVDKYYESGFGKPERHWANGSFLCLHRVKFDLFKRYGYIAAAGDRHLAEFCPGKWYLSSRENVDFWQFGLTPVSWRKEDLKDKIKLTNDILNRKEPLKILSTGEEGVLQMKALLGLAPITTNVNLPNEGQISNLPKGIVVETNASFSGLGVKPVISGAIPCGVDALVSRVAYNQQLTVESAISGDYELAFKAFVNDPLVDIGLHDARKLFEEMLKNTKNYLPHYDNFFKK